MGTPGDARPERSRTLARGTCLAQAGGSMKSTALVLLGLGFVLGGCTASSDAEEAEEAASDSAELVSGPGITLRATDDPALELNVKIADGVQPTTINQRFFKLTASRAGKSFSSWCKGIGSVGEGGIEQGIECYDSVS